MKYVIHSMHGPTVFQYERLQDAIAELFRKGRLFSNGGTYRVLDERGKEYASVNTYATYAPLCYEANQEMYAKSR